MHIPCLFNKERDNGLYRNSMKGFVRESGHGFMRVYIYRTAPLKKDNSSFMK